MADLIPNSTYILIEGVGHIPCVEVPELMANHILEQVP
jgi:pimeloyl-ACP methyl ester carboxylesterase